MLDTVPGPHSEQVAEADELEVAPLPPALPNGLSLLTG